MSLLYKLELRDDNSNVSTFYADDWASVETLGELIKSAATTIDYERFSADGALAVYDAEGTVVARTDGRSGWALPDHGLGR
ncbi:hypothetical protein M0D69_35555 [Caballeronia sp. SEWSISQ10-4 2]|uniref:hypothetical protein n=1 Tax=Caballeronia sp. SEWSISQ10-4 2 TaxID=2937438 RepID=UPI00264BD8A8|nr:hypothetical protein [Caballeronia sp. SEWSISQ10-4 2]MDN7183240.1 hypothetical protein [Caballeronia sp. SEWSISQ10-4 2]